MIRWLRFLLVLCLVSPMWGAARIAVASTGFTTAATWELVDHSATTGVAYLDSEAGTTAIPSPNPSYSANFQWAVTAPTVDGVAVKFATRAAVASGTITVILRDVTGGADVKTVTVNVSDIQAAAPQGWYFFKFDAATALVAANNYAIGVKSSAAAQGTLYRDATAANWSRMLRTTATAAPAANDQLHVLGEWTAAATVTAITVTMDETATTSYGPTVAGGPPQGFTIGSQGILDWGTTAATNYILYVKGILRIYPDGTMNIGTVGTPMPANSTALYQMTSVANVDSGLVVTGTLNVYGATKTNVATLLTADAADAQPVLTVADTTGWAAGDTLAIASTSRTPGDVETGVIQTVDTPTQVTLTGNLANAHSGTSPTQAEVINLTHNVMLRGASALLQGYVVLSASSVTNIRYSELYWFGSSTANKRGIDIQTVAGSFTAAYSALHDFAVGNSSGFFLTGGATSNVTVQNCVTYNVREGNFAAADTTGTWDVQHNIFMKSAASGAVQLNSAGAGSVFHGNTVTSGVSGTGVAVELNGTTTIQDFTLHSQSGGGALFGGSSGLLIDGMTAWRNASSALGDAPIQVTTDRTWYTLKNYTAFGNQYYNLNLYSVTDVYLRIENMISSGDSTFSTPVGINLAHAAETISISMVGSSFSAVTGIKTAHITADIRPVSENTLSVYAWDTIFNTVPIVANIAGLVDFGVLRSGLWSQKHNNTAGDHRRFLPMGDALTNTVTFRTASPSEELVPSSASVKMESGPKQAAVASGNTVTWSVWVYKSVGYAGAQPRLMLRTNPAIGIATDTLLDTMAGAAGAWEELTGVTAAATDDGVFEAFVDCDTSGSIYVDDWSANGTLISENRGWWNGTPMVVAGVEPIGGDKYWWTGAPAIGFPPSGPAPGGAVPVINNPILISRRETVGRP